MESLLKQPIRCPILVGRTTELASLVDRLELAVAGAGRVVLLAGEAGIGKSRLVDELVAVAQRRGVAVRRGFCFEPDRSVPYAPISEMLGQDPTAIVTPESSLSTDPAAERQRRVSALRDAILAPARSRPLLVVVEDLHWCDEASLDLIAQVARRIAMTPAMLLLTHRSDETTVALFSLLASLDRLPYTTEIRLGRLRDADTEAMLRAILSLERPVRRDFLDALEAVTEGNPLFVEEAIKSLLAAGHVFFDGTWFRHELAEIDIPRSVQDAVRRRTEGLSNPAKAVLRTAAVAGRRFDFDLLRAALAIDETSLLECVNELVAAQLLVEESPDRFAFRHALTRQAVLAPLLGRERRLLHRRIAETLEQLSGPTAMAMAPELARHYSEAGEPANALPYARLAGNRALALESPGAAFEHFTRAIDAAETVGLPPEPQLFRLRARAAETLGRFDDARVDLERTIAEARNSKDLRTEWQALIDLGLLWASRDYAASGALLDDALAKARELNDPAAIAQSLNRRGNWRLNVGDPVSAKSDHMEALASFLKLGAPRDEAATLDLLGMATAHCGDPIRAAEHYRRATELYRALHDRRGLVSALAMLAQLGAADNRIYPSPPTAIVDPVSLAREAIAVAREIDWRPGEAFALIGLSFAAAVEGEIAVSLEAARAAVALAEEIDHRLWLASAHSSVGLIYGVFGAFPAAVRHLERGNALASELGSAYFVGQISVFLGWTHRLAGDIERADAVLDKFRTRFPMPHPFLDRIILRLRGELALASGDASGALDVADSLLADGHTAWGASVTPPSFSLLRGQALTALGRIDEAEAVLIAAREIAKTQRGLPLHLDLERALFDLYRALGDKAEMARATETQQALFARILANISDAPDPDLDGRSLRDQAREFLLPPAPLKRTLTPLQAAKQTYAGLTAREREVAAQIARGRTNRDIADQLSIGERTVVTHVTHILTKLGFNSRAQIAVWAADKGLREPDESSPNR